MGFPNSKAKEDKEKAQLQRLTELWKDAREEIRQRIVQRDRYVIQMMVGFVTVIAASRFVPGIWMLCPLPLYYYSIMTYHSYLIHKQLSFYMSEHLEKKIRSCLKGPGFDYIEYESFFKLADSVGVRKWLFVWVPWLVFIVLMACSLLISIGGGVLGICSDGGFGLVFIMIMYFAALLVIACFLKFFTRFLYFLPAFIVLSPVFLVPWLLFDRPELIECFSYALYQEQTHLLYMLFLLVVTFAWQRSIAVVEKKMISKFSEGRPSLGIIGNGEVVKKKYLPLLASGQEFRTVEVVGGNEEHAGYSVKALSSVIFDKMAYHIDQPDIWVVATPTPTHFYYYQLVRNLGCKVAVEKPATTETTHYRSMRGQDFNTNRSRNWFPLAYYLLEKGLPLLFLLDRAFGENKDYQNLIKINGCGKSNKIDYVNTIRERLGPIVSFKGVIFEGASSNSLAHRPWVVEKDGGGNLWETLFHLVSMSAVAAEYNNGISFSLSVDDVKRFTYDIEGVNAEGDIGCYAEIDAGQELPWLIATAKGVSEKMNKREVCLVFRNGYVGIMDFSNCTLVLYKNENRDTKELSISLKFERKYQTQFMLMKAWLASEGNNLVLPMRAYDTAVSATAIMAEYRIEHKPEMKGADSRMFQELGWRKDLFWD